MRLTVRHKCRHICIYVYIGVCEWIYKVNSSEELGGLINPSANKAIEAVLRVKNGDSEGHSFWGGTSYHHKTHHKHILYIITHIISHNTHHKSHHKTHHKSHHKS